MTSGGSNYRSRLTAVLTFIGGLYFFLEFILPARVLQAVGVAPFHQNISYGFITVGAMAFGLGLINLFMIHGSRVLFQRKGWVNSFALLAGLLLMMGLAVFDWISGLQNASAAGSTKLLSRFAVQIRKDAEAGKTEVPPVAFRMQKLREALEVDLAGTEALLQRAESNPDRAVQQAVSDLTPRLKTVKNSLEGDGIRYDQLQAISDATADLSVERAKLSRAVTESEVPSRLFKLLRNGLFVALGSAMFSLLAFYIAAAAYRAFRIRSYESALMMTAALIVMCGQMSFTLRIYEGFSVWRDWLMNVPNTAAFRAIRIGAAVAGLVLAFRMWFSIESQSFSEKK